MKNAQLTSPNALYLKVDLVGPREAEGEGAADEHVTAVAVYYSCAVCGHRPCVRVTPVTSE